MAQAARQPAAGSRVLIGASATGLSQGRQHPPMTTAGWTTRTDPGVKALSPFTTTSSRHRELRHDGRYERLHLDSAVFSCQ